MIKKFIFLVSLVCSTSVNAGWDYPSTKLFLDSNDDEYITNTFFGIHDLGPDDAIAAKLTSDTFTTIRLLNGFGGAGTLSNVPPTGCGNGTANSGYNSATGCGDGSIWHRVEQVQGEYRYALIDTISTRLKARGITKVLIGYTSPPDWALRGNKYEVQNVSIALANSTITATANNLANAERVIFYNVSGGDLTGTGFAFGTAYWVVNRTANSIQLSTTQGGAAIIPTGNSSGTISILLRRSIPGNIETLKTYVRAVIQRYVDNGMEVLGYDGVNEPNLQAFHQPSLEVDTVNGGPDVAAIQCAIAEAVRTSAAPHAKVFLAAPNTLGRIGDTGGIYYLQFYDALSRGCIDVASIHAYFISGKTTSDFNGDLIAFKDYFYKRGFKGPFAISEYSYSAGGTAAQRVTYVAPRIFLLAAHKFKYQFVYAMDASGWEMATQPSGPTNVYGTMYLTVRSHLLGFKSLGDPIISGDVIYADFVDRHSRRLRAVWTISGGAGSHTAPSWAAKRFDMSNTETATSPGDSVSINGEVTIIESQ